jgi:uncharacterized membrane protein
MRVKRFPKFIRIFILIPSLVILIFAGSSSLRSDVQPDPDVEEEIIEELEEITVVVPEKAIGFWEILGRLHPAVVHFPIGWLMMVVIIDMVAFILGKDEWASWGLYVLIGTVLSFAPAIFTGFLNASSLSPDSPSLSLMETHRNLNLLVAVLCAAALVLRIKKGNALEGGSKWSYLGLILISAALLALSGHIGGKMVFGENYLPF